MDKDNKMVKIDKNKFKEFMKEWGNGAKNLIKMGIVLVIIINFLEIFFYDNNSDIDEEHSNGDTRIETYTEYDFNSSAYSNEGFQEQWEETYYNGEWIPTEEYERITDELAERAEFEAMEAVSIPVYFINNGYYYHEDINCKGLEGYSNLNEIELVETQYYKNLKPCNWCSN